VFFFTGEEENGRSEEGRVRKGEEVKKSDAD
jgi:hypothetical protein